MKKSSLTSVILATSLIGSASAASLSLDFQPTGGTTAVGFLPFQATNLVIPVMGSDYAAFGSTVTVSLSVANLPDGAADFRAVARNGAAGDSFNDWIGVDTRAAGVNVTLTISLAGLPAGDYTWLSQHHDGGTGTTNGNLNGSADALFTDANGAVLTPNGVTFSTGNLGAPVSTFFRNFTSNGSPVSLSMIMDNGQGGTATTALFAFANSLVIDQVPEPTAAVLGAFGMLGLLRRRR